MGWGWKKIKFRHFFMFSLMRRMPEMIKVMCKIAVNR